MKKITLISLLTIFVLSSPVHAQDAEREFDETTLLLHSKNYQDFEDLLVDCAWATPYLPMDAQGGWTSDLYAISTNDSTGKATGTGDKVAEMWTCFDSGQEVLTPFGPSFENAIAYGIFIDGEILGALGIVNPPLSYREEFPLYSITAGVSIVVDDVPGETIGALTITELIDRPGVWGGSNGIVTLRLFGPRNYDQEALAEALKRAFGVDVTAQ
ncbi:MAG: hypothetical protein ABJK20_18355 [Halieaceae bacterium]